MKAGNGEEDREENQACNLIKLWCVNRDLADFIHGEKLSVFSAIGTYEKTLSLSLLFLDSFPYSK